MRASVPLDPGFEPHCAMCNQPFDCHLDDGSCLFGPAYYYPGWTIARVVTPIYDMSGKVVHHTMGYGYKWDGSYFTVLT